MTRFEPSTFGGQQLHYQLSHQHHPPRVSKCFKWANPGFFLFIFVVSIQHKSSISIDGMLRIRTRVRRMVGADKTTELCRPPQSQHLFVIGCLLLLSRYVNLRVWRHRLRHRRHTPVLKLPLLAPRHKRQQILSVSHTVWITTTYKWKCLCYAEILHDVR